MIRKDGSYRIFVIETRFDDYKNANWFLANLDHFGSPKGFGAGGDCWQTTGVTGTFKEKEAKKGLGWIRKRYPESQFRLAAVHISQMKVPVP